MNWTTVIHLVAKSEILPSHVTNRSLTCLGGHDSEAKDFMRIMKGIVLLSYTQKFNMIGNGNTILTETGLLLSGESSYQRMFKVIYHSGAHE